MLIFDRSHSAPKNYTYGTHRLCDPDETLQSISPHFQSIGLTRIADVTGLDSIDIPVCMAIRPNSQSVSVCQGKGLTLGLAKVSAAMEAMEAYHAENVRHTTKLASYRELVDQAPVSDPSTLNLHPTSYWHEDLSLAWIQGFDLIAESQVWVPYDLIHGKEPIRNPIFSMSSNGLAAGNHILEALSHAICEVVEQDASFLWEIQNFNLESHIDLLDLATVDSLPCRELIDKLDRAGVNVYIWDQTSEVGIPCFNCTIIEHDTASSLNVVGPYSGSGCHLSKEIALIRAITEAAQSRVTHISGARDDMFRKSYMKFKPGIHTANFISHLENSQATLDFNSLPSLESDSLEEDVSTQLTMLSKTGFDQVIAVDLTHEEIAIPVLRVIIPNMELEFNQKYSNLQRNFKQHTKERLLKINLTSEFIGDLG